MAKFSQLPRPQLLQLAAKGGKAPRPKVPRREFCNKRHRLSDDNVDIVQRTSYNADRTKAYTYLTYRCRQCTLEAGKLRKRQQRAQQRAAKLAAPRLLPNTCGKGHALTGSNLAYYQRTRVAAGGHTVRYAERVCLQCRRERYRAQR